MRFRSIPTELHESALQAARAGRAVELSFYDSTQYESRVAYCRLWLAAPLPMFMDPFSGDLRWAWRFREGASVHGDNWQWQRRRIP
jgi:hypothetical protein